jgi:hypothetical protein
MRNLLLLAALAASVAAYATTALDLSDFDPDVMGAIEDTKKELESYIAGKEAEGTRQSAAFIRESLSYAEQYFDRKGNVPDAVALARQGQEAAAEIARAAGEGRFDAAYDSYIGLLRACKKCHDAYKPPEL